MEQKPTLQSGSTQVQTSTENFQQTALEIFRQLKTDFPVKMQDYVLDHEKYPSISSLQAHYGTKTLRVVLTLMIEDCIASIQIKQPSKEMVIEMANELISDYPTFKLQDFSNFFLNYRKGKYGKDYNRFDISTLYLALQEFNKERTDAFEFMTAKRKGEYLGSKINEGTDMQKVYEKAIRQTAKKLKITSDMRDAFLQSAKYQHHNDYMEYCKQNNLQDSDAVYLEYQKKYPFNQTYIEWFIK